MPRVTRRLPALLSLLLAGCATSVASIPFSRGPEPSRCCHPGDEPIVVEYLGAGGWLFRMGDAVILTAPFFSNPGLLEVALGRIESDTVLVERFLPPVEDVDAVLVGHAHYDHLMDVPYVLRRRAPRARLYGSRTAVNLLRGDVGLNPGRLVSVEEIAGDHESPGEWVHVAGGRIRFMALRSGHAPHFMGIHLYHGDVEAPADALPRRAAGWREGTPLAYLIDFLSPGGEVVYRVHYQDAASEPPMGFPPSPFDGIPVDLAILCPPGYEEVRRYPEGILEALKPASVLLGHWEDFFTPRTQPLRRGPGTDLDTFIRRMEGALPEGSGWTMLEPGSSFQVPGRSGSRAP